MTAEYIDLQFRGSPRVIATALLDGPGGLTLIDPGPTSCLPALEAGLRGRGLTLRDVRTLLLTHIHLDHAGATGTILERVPNIRVYVHERGAPHMIDPAKLLASATRLHGDRMEALWGAFQPVPASQITALAGGERLDMGGTSIRVAYTPGHAKHHVSYLDERSGMAYVGDTGGVHVTRRLSAGADAAARHRYRGLAGECEHDRCLAAGVAVSHALRSGHAGPRSSGAVPHDAGAAG